MAVTVRVLIADDHALVRRGTREILQQHPAIEVIGEAADGEEALLLIEQDQPEVVLMDLGMPGMSGMEAMRRIKERWPAIRVIILTVHGDDEYVFEAIRAGASGFLLKNVRDRELINAVLTVGEGGAVIDTSLVQTLVGGVRGPSIPSENTEALTKRELEILRLVARGQTNRAVGDQLGLSSRTVEVHLRKIFAKLDVNTRTQAAIAGLSSGLLLLEELQ